MNRGHDNRGEQWRGAHKEIDSKRSGNPSLRRHGLAICFECEFCGRTIELTIAQHKGQSLLAWRGANGHFDKRTRCRRAGGSGVSGSAMRRSLPQMRCLQGPGNSHGLHDASTDADQIHELWSKYPGKLVGVPTGKKSGFDVLDLDSAKQPEAVPWWMSNRQRIPHTRIHQTGSGGLHVIFKHNSCRTGNNRLGQGIDVKANGGYIVWWPAFGRRVSCDAPVNEWPDWLIAKQQPKAPPIWFPAWRLQGSWAGCEVRGVASRGRPQLRCVLGILPSIRSSQCRACL